MDGQLGLDEIQWSNPEWIQSWGLNYFNVLEYFSLSPYFDRNSNNQVLRMQYQFDPQFQHITQTNPRFIESLQQMTGIEFIVHENGEPSYYLIRKQYRHSPQHVDIQSDYYVINGNIYLSTTVFGILNSRLLNILTNFKKSYGLFGSLTDFSTTRGHQFSINDILKNIHELKNRIDVISVANESLENTADDNSSVAAASTTLESTSSKNNTEANKISVAATENQHSSTFDNLLHFTMQNMKGRNPSFGVKFETPPQHQPQKNDSVKMADAEPATTESASNLPNQQAANKET